MGYIKKKITGRSINIKHFISELLLITEGLETLSGKCNTTRLILCCPPSE